MNSLQVLATFFFLIFTIRSKANPILVKYYCSNDTTNFKGDDAYKANRDSLLSFLVSNSTNTDLSGYYSSSGRNPDLAYGLFLCRPDLSHDVCQSCVSYGAQEIVQRCPLVKVGVAWYEECVVRYANVILFSISSDAPGVYLSASSNTTTTTANTTRFNEVVSTTLNETATDAANGRLWGSTRFAVNEVGMDSLGLDKLYTLVECISDQSNSDCYDCLRSAISHLSDCCGGKMGGQVLMPDCYFRYEVNNMFYNASGVLAASPSPVGPAPSGKSGVSSGTIAAIVVPLGVVLIALSYVAYRFFMRGAGREDRKADEEKAAGPEIDITSVESLQFDLVVIEAATNNFSMDNRLGQGGFGEVHKGILADQQEIAVKRLSKRSTQGAEEFKNEVMLLAKLQHKNLARLLGFCLQGEEKILIYEFLPNKSLDSFLFGPLKKRLLDWSLRYKIIRGIARGILYLHEDSQLCIIHRDLKCSNILLDANMNPKISDFGMARIFGVDQTEAKTSRIVDTYGYMSPEYAMRGLFSVKSDVYSFGVLVLELITGRKNNSFCHEEDCLDLISYVWVHWKDERPLEIIDPTLADTYTINEVVRCIQLGLLCVQEDPNKRPTMASIVSMLNSGPVNLALPQQPGFFYHITKESKMVIGLESVNEDPITEPQPR